MGCGSTNERFNPQGSISSINNTHNVNTTDVLPKEELTGSYSEINMINLENYDIINKLLNLPKMKKYIDLFLNIGYLNENFYPEVEDIHLEVIPLLDILFSRFKINYKISKEEIVVDVISYKLECTPCTNKDLDLYLPIFLLEFCLYPKTFIEKSKVRSVVFINSLEFSTSQYSQYRAACPEYNKTLSMYYCTKERSITYIRTVIHHEFFHYVDWTDDLTFEDKEWRTFNRKDFQYGNGGQYERVWIPLSPDCLGFINHYSTTGIEEDKAEIYQNFIFHPENALNHPDEIIRTKTNYLKKWLCNYDFKGMGKNNYFDFITDFRKKTQFI
jgi:hypothetical protein